MTIKNYLLQGVALCLIVSLSGFQSDRKGTLDASPIITNSAQTLTSSVMVPLIVDADSESNSYPSMEQEMRMYIQLQKSSPVVYLFPNPSSGVVWMEHNLEGAVELRVIDEQGETVLTLNDQQVKKLDFSDYEAGTFSLIVGNDNYSVKRPLLIK